MAVTDAPSTLATLAGASAGTSRALASAVLTNTSRMGLVLALVGPWRTSSYRARSSASAMSRGSQPLWLRACRNN